MAKRAKESGLLLLLVLVHTCILLVIVAICSPLLRYAHWQLAKYGAEPEPTPKPPPVEKPKKPRTPKELPTPPVETPEMLAAVSGLMAMGETKQDATKKVALATKSNPNASTQEILEIVFGMG
jgi:hypothetical protein